MGCPRSSLSASCRGLLPQEYLHDVAHFFHPCLRDRCDRKPEFIPRDPRDHAQPCIQGNKVQQGVGHVRQFAHWYPVLLCLQSELHPVIAQSGLTSVKGYHLEHHKYLGEDGIDTDLPTRLELVLLNNVFGKVFFA